MRDDRTAFLLRKQELMPLTEAERRELAETPEAVGERKPDGSWASGCMIVPRRAVGTYAEQLAAFARLQNIDGSETAPVDTLPVAPIDDDDATPDAPRETPQQATNDDDSGLYREPTPHERRMYGDGYRPKKTTPPKYGRQR
jgi:hypothetical protein